MVSPDFPIVLIDGVRYQLVTPKSEASLEKAIQSNCEHIFGLDSFYFDIKKMIRTKAGVASIPDGYAIFFTPKPQWAIIEVELASHPIFNHVIPQLSKFNRGIEDNTTRRQLVEVLYSIFDEDEVLKARLKRTIKTGEVYKFISDLVSEQPLIVVVIDQNTEELKEALKAIRGEVRVIEFRTFRREGISDNVNAFMFEPVFSELPLPIIDTENETDRKGRGIMHSVFELFDDKGVDNVTYHECESIAREVKPDTKFGKSHFSWYKNKYKRKRKGGLPRGLKLRNVYKGIEFTAEVVEDGKIRFRDHTYESPSAAAIAAIQSTGLKRKTENGWTWWKFVDHETGEEKPLGDVNAYITDSEGRTDNFGSRLGSNQAKINAVLSKEPKTMKTLVEEAGLSSTYYNHLKRLIEKGFIKKTDKGFKTIFDHKKISDTRKRNYSDFWEPIRREGLFKGKPVPVRDEAWIAKGIKGVTLILQLRNHKCSILLSLKGPDRTDRRDKVAKLFPKTKYEYEVRESSKFATITFPVLDKGKKDREHWPEIRENLTKLGADIYSKIKESDT